MNEKWERIVSILTNTHIDNLSADDQLELNEWLCLSQDNRMLFNELQDQKVLRLELAKLQHTTKQAGWEFTWQKAKLVSTQPLINY